MKKIAPWMMLLLLTAATACNNNKGSNASDSTDTLTAPAGRWTAERAEAWYQQQGGWLAGANYAPAYAVNELEMWQAETFDTAAIDKELGWAQQLGFNVIRVFLHNLLWQQDSTGMVKRMDQFLDIASRHGIGTMFVLFDGVWNPDPHTGKQPAPRPHVHNSGWVQAPGTAALKDTANDAALKSYVQGILTHFGNDSRVKLWDLFNEPDNDNGGRFSEDPAEKYKYAFILLRKVFQWSREVNPSQPLTVAPWRRNWSDTAKMDPMDHFMFDQSDVISFHCYETLASTQAKVQLLQRYGRPLICSEYMARPTGSTFQNILPYFKEQHVGAINWGFVSGKTQTIYPWDSWTKKYTAPPKVWFHDIFHEDGTPYDTAETALIRKMTGAEQQ
ncbi:cellulase family glycosylhydrolase [Compostibacter hankyongensis]|uniref:Glycoside hydrolase family 5 domain-containing protein n=1 Tax=Compostibacter hankyongensis TaxID=1007089 RepID=A0ABP8G3C6_9BACT